MKNIAKLLLLTIIVSLSFNLFGCLILSTWYATNSEFSVYILGVSGYKSIDFELSEKYYIYVKLKDQNVDKETYKDIQIEYNKDNAYVEYAYTSRDKVCFTIYLYELGNDNQLNFTYNGKTISVNYNVVDYDFEANGYETISSIDALDKYPEFKELILSIKYHEFEEPYIGLDGKWNFDYNQNNEYDNYDFSCIIDESNSRYITTDYVPYLLDSIYYPSKFNMGKNSILSYWLSMSLDHDTETGEGANRSTIKDLGIGFGVIDPGCTAHYPLTGMSFNAKPIPKFEFSTDSGETYPTKLGIWFERYSDKFFQYKLGDLTIYILCEKEGGASAYFFDDTYFYSINATYNQKYK